MRLWYKLIFLFCVCVTSVHGQVITGLILDSNTGSPISSAHIAYADQITYSNNKGEFLIRVYSLEGHLRISHVSYKDHNQILGISDFENAICELRIELQPKVIDIEEIVISENYAPDVVFSHKIKHVSDFRFKEDHLIVLTYNKEKLFKSQDNIGSNIFKGATIYLADLDHVVLDSLELGFGQYWLSVDFRDNVILHEGNQKYYIMVSEQKLDLVQLNADFYNSFLKVTADSLGENYYYSTFSEDFPAFDYYSFNSRKKTYNLLHQTNDELGLELLRSEYKYLDGAHKVEAMHLARELDIDKEVVAAYMTGFSESQYFNELYAPLYTRANEVLIFDHNDHMLHIYNSSDKLISKVHIDYHLKRGLYDRFLPNKKWGGKLFWDKENKMVFTSFEEDGYTYISEIDLKTGTTLKVQKLFHRYIDKLQINGGNVFYVFRPFESSQKKYLYQEEIYCGLSSSSK